MNVTKTELGAKVDGVEAQVGSLRTEMTAKINSLDAEMKSGFKRMRDKLNAQNPLTSWDRCETRNRIHRQRTYRVHWLKYGRFWS